MSTDEAVEQSDSHSAETTPGARLRAARRERNLSEKEVADTLHITVHYVKALETDRYDKLPGAVFARGYIKSYAQLLGLNPDQLLPYFEKQQSDKVSTIATAAQARKQKDKNRTWVIASIVAFVGGFILLWAINNLGDQTPSQASSPDEENVQGSLNSSVQSQNATQAEMPRPGERDGAVAPLEIASDNSRSPDAGASTPPSPASRLQPDSEREPLSEPGDALSVDAEIPTREAATQTTGVVEVTVPPSSPEADEEEAETGVATTTLVQTQAPSLEPDAATVPESGAAAPGEPESAEDAPQIAVSTTETGAMLIVVETPGEDVLELQFSGESWVEVNNVEGKRIYQNLRGEGDVVAITGLGPFNLLLGDAPMVDLLFNGDEVDVSDDIRVDNSARLTVGL